MVDLTFVTDDPNKQAICRDYWLFEPDGSFKYQVRHVAEKYGVEARGLSTRVSEWCKATSPEYTCVVCKQERYPFKSRSDYQERNRPWKRAKGWLCKDCKQRQQEEAARRAEEKKRENERIRANRWRQVRDYYTQIPPGSVRLDSRTGGKESHTLEQVVGLVSLIRLCGDEDLTQIKPLGPVGDGYLTPIHDYDVELLIELGNAGILRPSVDHSTIEAFEFDKEGNFTGRYYIYHVAYETPCFSIDGADLTRDPPRLVEILDAIFRDMSWPNDWNEQINDLWKKIAFHECLQYLLYQMKEHQFTTFKAGPKTHQVLKDALTTYSVAQVYNHIWGAARNAAAYYVRERIPKHQAANSVVGGIQRRIDQARAEGWEIKPYRRDWNCPQSMISRTFFDTVLQIGEEGFTRVPGS